MSDKYHLSRTENPLTFTNYQDMWLIGRDGQFRTQRLLLASNSPFLKQCIAEKTCNACVDPVVMLPDFSVASLHNVVGLLKSGKVVMNNRVEVLELQELILILGLHIDNYSVQSATSAFQDPLLLNVAQVNCPTVPENIAVAKFEIEDSTDSLIEEVSTVDTVATIDLSVLNSITEPVEQITANKKRKTPKKKFNARPRIDNLRNSVMRKHVKKIDSSTFECDICNKTFTKIMGAYRHVRCHNKEKLFLCDECPKRFRTQNLLGIHKRTHSGMKPYRCAHCGESFSLKGNLNRHVHRRHQGGEEEFLRAFEHSLLQEDGDSTELLYEQQDGNEH